MDEEAFLRELNKYKVIRRKDHHVNRTKAKHQALAITSAKGASSPRALVASSASASASASSALVVPVQQESFWELLKLTASQHLNTPQELNKFLLAMKKEHELVGEKVNLEDLETLFS